MEPELFQLKIGLDHPVKVVYLEPIRKFRPSGPSAPEKAGIFV